MKKVEKYSWFECDASTHFTWGLVGTISEVMEAFEPRTSSVNLELYKGGGDGSPFYRFDAKTPVKLGFLSEFEKSLEGVTMESSLEEGFLLITGGKVFDGFFKAYSGQLMWDYGVWDPIIDSNQFLRVKFVDEQVSLGLRVYGRKTGGFDEPLVLTQDVWEDEELVTLLVNIGYLNQEIDANGEVKTSISGQGFVRPEYKASKPSRVEEGCVMDWLKDQGISEDDLEEV